MTISITALDVSFALLGAYLLKRIFSSRSSAPLPPGPKGLPLIGNMLDMPTSHEWKTFAKWGDQWGNILSVKVLGQPIIILNSLKTATEMLEKKSAIYSDRPVLMMGSEIVGWKNTLALTPYGDRFREYRKMLHSLMGTRMHMERFHPIEELETHRFLRRILEKPDELPEHIRKTAGAIILTVSHGYLVKEHDDPFILNADIATDQFSRATEPGAFLVDMVPALRHVPEWFPGAGWKRTAKKWIVDLQRMADMPHEYVKQQMAFASSQASGTALPSFTSSYLDQKLTPEQEHNVKWAAASLYSGGADTTVSAIYSFFLAMTLYPEVQKKAQLELDSVIGSDRLPTYSDRANLPYVDALVKEVLRWNPVTPLGVTHRLMEDDIHDGYLIPKGSLVIPNIWNFLHDEQTYREPMKFNPDRFIASEGREVELDPHTFNFGFGRRYVDSCAFVLTQDFGAKMNASHPFIIQISSICPGMHLADASVYISCAMALAVLDITKAVENGVVVEPVNEYTNGTISHPKPFKCSIKPRSEKASAIITSVEMVQL
ncbi:hypothetical protein EW146_g2895 [Bondarzewia mesenterica]|uniref:Cytochrome P450 n=1 Tax=Bondarzewia mesenterica TaxID=1095465 RepID=A0A4S4M5F4_9AGAM|nr:hypothetical protein EW146_g2895 [Bondarzewia mesenterica]